MASNITLYLLPPSPLVSVFLVVVRGRPLVPFLAVPVLVIPVSLIPVPVLTVPLSGLCSPQWPHLASFFMFFFETPRRYLLAAVS